jgi:hypothetical protein
MPSQAIVLAAQAFEMLLDRNGEAVTFRKLQEKALVNRTPKRTPWKAGVSTDAPADSIIQFRAGLKEPKLGESIVDEFGFTHRIISVKHLGHAWECECASHGK